MRDKEEVETSFNDLRLLDESVIHIGTLRWVQDVSSVRTWVVSRLFEESLSHTLIDDDECGMGERFSLLFRVIFIS
jgi:hypothetical protein